MDTPRIIHELLLETQWLSTDCPWIIRGLSIYDAEVEWDGVGASGVRVVSPHIRYPKRQPDGI